MKVFIASVIQETNTFSPIPTDLSLFQRGYFLRGTEITGTLTGTNTEINGFCEFFSDKEDVELSLGVACWGVAAGKLTGEVEDAVFEDILAHLEAAMPVDGVLLALHGAMVSHNHHDCTGHLLSLIRDRVGRDIPVVASLDYHANITGQMVRSADALVGFRTYPHVDFSRTGYRAAEILYSRLRGIPRPLAVFRKLPLMVPVENSETSSGPSSEVISRLAGLDRYPWLTCASLFCCQPWLDVPEAGVSLLLYGDRDHEAEMLEHAKTLERYLMDNRTEYFRRYPSSAEALDQIGAAALPCILVDSGDITSAGGVGDSTVLLRELLARQFGLHCAMSIVDPDTVRRVFRMEIGSEADLLIGGGTDGYNARTPVHARIMSKADALSQVHGEAFSGVSINAGRRVYLLAGQTIHIIVSEYSTLFHDPQMLLDMGIDPRKMDLIVQKSHKLFRSAYREIAKEIIVLDTPGYTNYNLEQLPYRHLRRDTIYPFNRKTVHILDGL